ncbi:MAG: hypothetical protein ACK4PK_03595 [Alphaproteobacteria bacterium]
MKPHFNQKSEVNRDDALKLDFTLTLTGPAAGAEGRAETLAAAIRRWPQLRGTGDRWVSDVRAQLSETGAGQVVLKATEPAILDIQRQFATDILRVDPQPDVILPSRRRKPVDPFDVRFW